MKSEKYSESSSEKPGCRIFAQPFFLILRGFFFFRNTGKTASENNFHKNWINLKVLKKRLIKNSARKISGKRFF